MTKLEQLREELRLLDQKMQEVLDQKDRSKADLARLQDMVDQSEELQTEIRALEVGTREVRTENMTQEQYRAFGEYLQSVARAGMPPGDLLGKKPTGVMDQRLADALEERSTGLEESTPSLGGFLVTKNFGDEIMLKAHNESILYNKTTKIPITGNANGIKIPAVDETSRADGSRFGGVQSYWTGEGDEKTASYPKFMAVELNLHKLVVLCYATDELLEDAAALGQHIMNVAEKEIAFKLDDAILDGSGANKPLGVLKAPCLVSVTGGASAGTIVASDVVGMYKRMFPGSIGRAEWYTNVDSIDYLMGLNTKSLTTVDTMDGMPLWLPANSLAGRPFETLFGKRVNFIEQAKATGTLGDLLFGDFSQYLTINKGGLQSASSIHVRFIYDETVFRFVLRVDGQPWWNNALTPYKGADTQSPFVAIATRT